MLQEQELEQETYCRHEMIDSIRILAINGTQMNIAQKQKDQDVPVIQIDCLEKLPDGRLALDFKKRELVKSLYLVDGDGNKIARFTVDLGRDRQVIHATQGYLEVYDPKYILKESD